MSEGWRLVLYRGTFCAYRRDGDKPVRRSLGTADRELADKRFARFLADIRRDGLTDLKLVGDVLDAYIKAKPDGSYARQRGEWVRQAILKVTAPALLSLPVDALDKNACRQFAEARYRQGIKPGTVATNLGILRAAMNWAAGEKLIPAEPHMELPQSAPPRDRWLTQEEARALLQAAETPHIRLFIMLALHTAARAAAILDLTWDRVNEKFIDLNPLGRVRTRKGRAVVPMNPVLWETLTAARQGALTDHVIEWAGKPVISVKKGVQRAVARAGLEGVTPHTFRHTAATWMVQGNVPLPKVAGYLGHRDSRTTERVYGHHAPDYLMEGSGAIVARLHGGMLCAPGSNEPVQGERTGKTGRKLQA
jgi:integrase